MRCSLASKLTCAQVPRVVQCAQKCRGRVKKVCRDQVTAGLVRDATCLRFSPRESLRHPGRAIATTDPIHPPVVGSGTHLTFVPPDLKPNHLLNKLLRCDYLSSHRPSRSITSVPPICNHVCGQRYFSRHPQPPRPGPIRR